ncbi:hypothetical protein DSECCO2_213170 [anaerobic digester metagenome]
MRCLSTVTPSSTFLLVILPDQLLDHLAIRGEDLPGLDGKAELAEADPHLPGHVDVLLPGHGAASSPAATATRATAREPERGHAIWAAKIQEPPSRRGEVSDLADQNAVLLCT